MKYYTVILRFAYVQYVLTYMYVHNIVINDDGIGKYL